MNEILREQLKKLSSGISIKHLSIRKEINRVSELAELPLFPYEQFVVLLKSACQTRSKSVLRLFYNLIPIVLANLEVKPPSLADDIANFLFESRGVKKVLEADLVQQRQLQIIGCLLDNGNVRHESGALRLVHLCYAVSNNDLWQNAIANLSKLVLELSKQVSAFSRLFQDIYMLADGVQPKWLDCHPDSRQSSSYIAGLLCNPKIFSFLQESRTQHRATLQAISRLFSGKFTALVGKQALTQNDLFVALNYARVFLRCCEILEHDPGCSQALLCALSHADGRVRFLSIRGIGSFLNIRGWLLECFGESSQTSQSRLKTLLDSFDNTKALPLYPAISLQLMKIDNSIFLQEGTSTRPLIALCLQLLEHAFLANAGLPRVLPQYFHRRIYQMLKRLLRAETEERNVQCLMKIVQKLVELNGVLADQKLSAKYLRLACKLCESQSQDSSVLFNAKLLLVHKMLMNIVSCVGNYFTKECWLLVWNVFFQYEIDSTKLLLGSQFAEKVTELQIHSQLFESIFADSSAHSSDHLKAMIQTLFQSSYDFLEARNEAKAALPATKVLKLVSANLHRVNEFWDQTSDGLMCLVSSRVQPVRNQAFSTLSSLIILALREASSKEVLEERGLTHSRIMAPLVKIIQCKYDQFKLEILTNLKKLIVDFAHFFKEDGWSSVLEVLLVSSTDPLSLKRAFECCEIIVETYLPKQNSMSFASKLTQIICNIMHFTQEQNVRYMCLNKLWQVSDFLNRLEDQEAARTQQRHIIRVLCEDQREESELGQMRQSSIQILAEILVHNCQLADRQFWREVLVVHLKPFIISKKLDNREDEYKTLLNSFSKVLKKYFTLFEAQVQQQRSKDPVVQLFYQVVNYLAALETGDLLVSIVKVCRDLLQYCSFALLQHSGFGQLLSLLKSKYTVCSDPRRMKLLVTYLPAYLLDLLAKAFENGYLQVFGLAEAIFGLSKLAHSQGMDLPVQRIYVEQKPGCQFVDRIANSISSSYSQFLALSQKLLASEAVYNKVCLQSFFKIVNRSRDCIQPVSKLLKQVLDSKAPLAPTFAYSSNVMKPLWQMAAVRLIEFSIQHPQQTWHVQLLFDFMELNYVGNNQELSHCLVVTVKYLLSQFGAGRLTQHANKMVHAVLGVSHKLSREDKDSSMQCTNAIIATLFALFGDNALCESVNAQALLLLFVFKIKKQVGLVATKAKTDTEQMSFLLAKIVGFSYEGIKISSELEAARGEQEVQVLQSRNGHLAYLGRAMAQLIVHPSESLREGLKAFYIQFSGLLGQNKI